MNLSWENKGIHASSILVCNSLGQVVMSAGIPAGLTETSLSLRDLSAGNYIVSLSQGGHSLGSVKLVKD